MPSDVNQTFEIIMFFVAMSFGLPLCYVLVSSFVCEYILKK